MITHNETTATTATYELRSIDAWNTDGWVWNASYHIRNIAIDGSLDGVALSRHVAKKLRDEGYLAGSSKGRIRVDDDGDTIVIEYKSTGEPLFALIPTE